MADQEDGQERNQDPTPKRLQEARERGDILRSRELATPALMLGASALFGGLGAGWIGDLSALMQRGLTPDRHLIVDDEAILRFFVATLLEGLRGAAPFLATMCVIALAAPVLLGGISFSAKAFTPSFERIDPLKGIARHFGIQGLTELGKTLLKFGLLGGTSALVLWADRDRIMTLGRNDVAAGLQDAAALILHAFLVVSATTLVIAAVDVPVQFWQRMRRLRMSLQELRDEAKETEGRPEVKARIRSLQQEVARRRMMAEVPRADVVVTNPTHYAVALAYDRARARAPRVVAKGVEEVAARIREVAGAHRVPIVSAPQLARALHRSTKLEQEIPAGLYHAVAQVLAYVMQLRATGGHGAVTRSFTQLPIPPEFQTEAGS